MRKQWLQGRDQVAAAAPTTEEPRDKCLYTVSGTAELPSSYVDVSCNAGGGNQCKAAALVDTGSTRTFLSKSVVDDLGADICGVPPGSGRIVALDGNPLEVLGTLNASLCQLDGPVHLEPIVVTVLVVPSLSVIRTDALIGSDVIERSGGLDMSCDSSGLCSVRFGSPSKSDDSPATVTCAATAAKLSRHIDVLTASEDGILMVDDGEIRWSHEDGYWEVKWNWANGREPASRLGSSIREYLRKRLTEKEESLFCNEVQTLIDNGWLVLHDPDVHSDPAAVLPLMAVSQQHKSTPVRPVLDYHALYDTTLSMPGTESPVCEEKLRKWRMEGNATEFEMLDIRRAYLQVRVSPELHRYQTVIWQ